jgi:CHAT domain-containing protein/Tfp pilus assembly protein PilF
MAAIRNQGVSHFLIWKALLILLIFSNLSYSQTRKLPAPGPETIKNPYAQLIAEVEKATSGGQYERALDLSAQAYSAAQKAKYIEGCLTSLIQKGFLYWNLGRMKESLEAFSQAMPIAKELSLLEKERVCTISLEIYDLYVQGKEDRDSGRYQNSIEKFRKAIESAKAIQSKGHELKCLRQLSLNYWGLKDFQEFFLLNKMGLAIAQEMKHSQEEGRCLNNIGLFYWQIDNYAEALKYYEKALRISRDLKNKEEENNCLTNIALIYIDIGDYDRALEYSLVALETDRELKDPASIAKDLNNIGTIYVKKGTASEQKEAFRKALSYYSESKVFAATNNDISTEIKVLNNIGSVHSYMGEYAKSLEYFQSALDKAQKAQDAEEMSIILNNIGIVYSQIGNYEESTRYYQRVIDLALETKGKKVLWEAYFEIANSYRNQNLLPAALENYRKSISVIENIRSSINLEELRATYLGSDKRIDAYYNLIDLFIRLQRETHQPRYLADAFRFLEKAKARAFLDSIEVSKLDLSKGISQQLLNKETDLMNEISQLHTKLLVPELSQAQRSQIDQELSDREGQLDSLRREIRDVSPAYANLNYPRTLTLQESQNELIDKDTACFAYLLAKENSYGFVITQGDIKIFPLPGKKEIQNLVQEHLKAITDVTNQEFRLGHRLFEILIEPGLSAKIRNMIIVPDDVLYFLPFETLLSKDDGKDWLIRNYTIAYAPSLSALRELVLRRKAIRKRPIKDILAVGDPSYGAGENESIPGDEKSSFQAGAASEETRFVRLKFSGQEIEKISALFKPARKDALLRDRASEENVKSQNLADYRIIHFATHAFIDDKKPARSAIILSLDQDPKEDGFLQMREVFNLKLQADLVVLSACQTGLGQLIRGEGIEGLSRAFFYAGASSVLLSLWAVNDQASYQLLERFYAHLRSANPVMESLRQAKLELIESGVLAHPYYWAGFVVTGNADTTIFPRSLDKWMIVTLSLCAGLAILLLVINREKPINPRPKKLLGNCS